MNKIISPSLLSCDFLNIEKELSYFAGLDDFWFHLDIMDGHFVPNLTFGEPIIKMISKKTKLPLDAHLMVTNPSFHIKEMKDYGIHNITFHVEAHDAPEELVTDAKQFYPSVGISIKPKTAVSKLSLSLLEKIDLVLVMSVEPGFGGQKFMPESFEKIKELDQIRKSKNLSFMIQVDGGVSDQNAKDLYHAGADNLVAGSYVFKEGPNSYLDKIQSLRNL